VNFRSRVRRPWAIAFCLLCGFSLYASEPLVFSSAESEERFLHLTRELRCLVCQNQTLADSDAPLAADLRLEIKKMIDAGRSDEEIRTFLVDRYGDFVLYRPPLAGNALALWLFPALLLLGGGAALVVAVKRRSKLPPDADEERETNEERGA